MTKLREKRTYKDGSIIVREKGFRKVRRDEGIVSRTKQATKSWSELRSWRDETRVEVRREG